MSPRLHPVFGFVAGIAGVVAVAVACGGGGFSRDVPCDPVEGVVDAGFCDEDLFSGIDLDGGDGGSPPENDARVACDTLITSTCGEGDICRQDPGCVAADLLSRFEPQRCAEALGDARGFPPCALGTCARLAAKVCGGDAPASCEGAPGCAPARALEARAGEGDVSANESCASALADEVLFPPCQ